MKFLSLEIENFLAIGSGRVELDSKGLCLIQGVNNDDSSATSNGVGKSSIPDALCWAIYGETARGVSGDAVVNKTAKKDTWVGVTIVDGHSTYGIDRYRKHRTMKNQTTVIVVSPPSHTCVELTKGTEKETQEVINQIMGCSLDVFRAAVYAGQEAMPDLPKMTDKQLKLLIEEAAGVDRLEAAHLLSREKLNEAKGRLNLSVMQKSNVVSQIGQIDVKLAARQIEFDNFESGRLLRHQDLLEGAKKVKEEILSIGKEALTINEPTLTASAAGIDLQLANHSKLLAEQNELLRKLQQSRQTQTRLSTLLESAQKRAKEIAESLKTAADSVTKPCVTCGKPGNEHDLETYKEHVTKQFKEAMKVVQEYKQELELVEAFIVAEKTCYDSFSGTIPNVTALSARRSEIGTLLATLNKLKNALNLKRKEYEGLMLSAVNKLSEDNPHGLVMDHLKREKQDSLKQLSEKEDEISSAQDNLTLYENVVNVFGPSGVRAHILDTVTPFLNDRTADYLSTLSDGNINAVWSTLTTTAKGDLKEKFNIEVTNDKGADSFAGLSGGEKRKVRLSTMLALQDLVASRATKSIELYIADEVDDALDPAGLERLMSVLDRKAKERGTVLVISHNSLTDWIDQVCMVTKQSGLSTIDGALSS